MRGIALAAGLTLLAPAQVPEPPWQFSEVMRELSADPRFVESFLARLDRNPAAGVLLGPENVKRLREILFGKQWERLDTFPGITLPNLGRGVWAAGKAIARPAPPAPETVPPDDELSLPADGESPDPASLLEDLGFDLTWGDQADETLWRIRPSSARLAEVLNRLALHGDDGYRVRTPRGAAKSPADLVRLLQEDGFTVTFSDARYFANFGDLRYRNRDVATPFWIDTGLRVPGTKRTLLVPASHSQTEVRVERKALVAAAAFFFGIDGKAAYRPLDTRDQSWVGGRAAHLYEGERARDAARAVGEVIRGYWQAQQAYPDLPFGGYYALGVCNDASAMVEQLLEGGTTLFPLVMDRRYFEEAGILRETVAKLPNDRQGAMPAAVPRIAASIPFDDLARMPLPQLRADLPLVVEAARRGNLARSGSWFWYAGLALAAGIVWYGWTRRRRPPRTHL